MENMKEIAILFLSTSCFLMEKVAGEWPASIMLPYEFKVAESTPLSNEVWLRVKMPKLADQTEQSLIIYFSNGHDLTGTRLKLKIKFDAGQHRVNMDQYLYAGSSQQASKTYEKDEFKQADPKHDFAIFTMKAWIVANRVVIWTYGTPHASPTYTQWYYFPPDGKNDENIDKIRFVRVEGAHVELLYVREKTTTQEPAMAIPLKMVPGMRIFLSGSVEKTAEAITVVKLQQGGKSKNLLSASYHDRRNDEYDKIAQLWQRRSDSTIHMVNKPKGKYYGALDTLEEDCFTWALEFYDEPGTGLIKVFMFDTLVGQVNTFLGYTFINGSATLIFHCLEPYTAAFWVKAGDKMVQVDPLTLERSFPDSN